MSNTFGTNLRVTIFGQSHAPAIGAVIDGLPAGMKLNMEHIQAFLARRAPGSSALSTARREQDLVRILSGLNERGETCGAPLCAIIENIDTRPLDYDALRDVPRPGHADYTAHLKFCGANDIRGGGQFSGRLTAPLCFAGAVCMQLPVLRDVRIGAHLLSIGSVSDSPMDPMGMDEAELMSLALKPLPTLSDAAGERMQGEILTAKRAGDSVGGVIEALALNVPAGLGAPMFDSIESSVAQLLFSIPGVRGVEFGLGFEAARMKGSQHNDAFILDGGQVRTRTNNHGGALGGITSGMPILLRVAMKPTPSIAQAQQSVSLGSGEPRELIVSGRHDPCIAPRAVPCVEAALCIALADAALRP